MARIIEKRRIVKKFLPLQTFTFESPWKPLTLLWINILLFFSVSAQNISSDSLENLLLLSKDTARIHLLNKLSEIYSRRNSPKGLPYAEEALSLSEKLNFQTGHATALRCKAIAYFFANNHQKSIEYMLLSSEEAALNHQWALEGQNYLNVGGAYGSVLGNYSKAMEFYTRALNVFESHHLTDKLHDAYGGIAAVYEYQGEYEKALDYFDHSIQLLRAKSLMSPGDISSLAVIYQKIGNIHMKENQPEEAQSYYAKALENFRSVNSKGGMIVVLVRLSDVYRQRKELDRALGNDMDALKLSEGFTYERGRFYCVESLGKTYREKKDFEKSKAYFEEAVAIAQRANMAEKLTENYENLAEVCSLMKDFEMAFHYQQLQAVYADSVRSKEQTNKLAEMEVRFETDRKEKENQLLKKDNDLKKLYIAISVLVLVSIAVIAVLMINHQRIKMKSQSLIAEKEKKLLEAELKNTQLNETQLRSEIEYKNKELTTYTLNLIQKNEILEELKTTLEQIRTTAPPDFSGKLNGLISSVNFSFHLDREWEGFKKHFEEVHDSFFEKLRSHFPDLNTNDMKLCALLKLNLETKEVATILGISPDSAKVARHRLRKKLNLPTDQNLTVFLSSI